MNASLLQEKYNLLLEEHKTLKSKYEETKSKYEDVKCMYAQLKNEYDVLTLEYSENTIIQSMNDMKERYEELVNSSVSLYKYEYLEKKWNNMKEKGTTVVVLLDYLASSLRKMEYDINYNSFLDEKKVEFQMIIMKELLEEGLK